MATADADCGRQKDSPKLIQALFWQAGAAGLFADAEPELYAVFPGS